MKRGKIWSIAIAFSMAMLLSFTSVAASHEVSDATGLENAFTDSDAEVHISLKADVNASGTSLVTGAGQTYNINGNGYVLTDVSIGGAGTVNIHADLEGVNEDALNTQDSVSVNVTGNITSANDGVNADDDSNITIVGDITVVSDGVDTDDKSSVTVTGDVISTGADAVDSSDESSVTVTGNVAGYDAAIEASENATVIVNGNANGLDGRAPDNEGNLETGNMNESGGYSDGGAGIDASDNSKVAVSGNVTGGDAYGSFGYAGTGILANDQAAVQVGGNVTGGNQIANPEVEISDDEYGVAGDGVEMESTANVMIGGNVTGGDSSGQDGYAGYGAYVILIPKDDECDAKAGSLTVGGTIKGGKATAKGGQDGYGLCYLHEVYDDGKILESEAKPEELILPEIKTKAIIGGRGEDVIGSNLTEETEDAAKAKITYTVESKESSVLGVNPVTGDDGTVLLLGTIFVAAFVVIVVIAIKKRTAK